MNGIGIRRVSIAIAMLCLIAAVFFLRRRPEHAAPDLDSAVTERTEPEPVASTPPRSASARAQAVVPSDIEQRLRRLEERDDGVPLPATPQPPRPQPTPMPSAAEAAVRLDVSIQEHTDFHESQPRDPAWAATQRAAIDSSFESLSHTFAFTAEQVDCRSETCIASVRFQNYDAARQATQAFAVAGYGNSCRRFVAMPIPESITDPYIMRVFLDCPH